MTGPARPGQPPAQPGRPPLAGSPLAHPPPAGVLPGDPPDAGRPLGYQRIALVDLLDRVLAGGVVIMGEVRLAIADVDLVTISLQALISSVRPGLGLPADDGYPAREGPGGAG